MKKNVDNKGVDNGQPGHSKLCSISNWGCIYHACMSDDCQKEVMLSHGYNEEKGECEKNENTEHIML